MVRQVPGPTSSILSLRLSLLFEPNTSLASSEVPDLVSLDEADGDGNSLGRKGTMNYARFFRCKDPPDFCPVRSDVIGVFG